MAHLDYLAYKSEQLKTQKKDLADLADEMITYLSPEEQQKRRTENLFGFEGGANRFTSELYNHMQDKINDIFDNGELKGKDAQVAFLEELVNQTVKLLPEHSRAKVLSDDIKSRLEHDQYESIDERLAHLYTTIQHLFGFTDVSDVHQVLSDLMDNVHHGRKSETSDALRKFVIDDLVRQVVVSERQSYVNRLNAAPEYREHVKAHLAYRAAEDHKWHVTQEGFKQRNASILAQEYHVIPRLSDDEKRSRNYEPVPE